MSAAIHPTAIVEDGATLGEGVSVGPFCRVGADVTLGDGAVLESHVVVEGHTTIGARTRIHPFACLGGPPQDLKFDGSPTRLVVGADCTIREAVTMHRGTPQGGGETRVGDRCFILAYAHVAHDNHIGNNVVLTNTAMLGGHVTIGDFAIVGGGAGIHQFVRIGAYAFVGGLAAVEHDVIPYGMAIGNRADLAGLNLVGLKRRGFSREAIHTLRRAYRELFEGEGTLAARADAVEARHGESPQVREVLDFVRSAGKRSIMTPAARSAATAASGASD
ncbi:acyl-ACP--UDP-N-acetylglucosamine O-acyltransferase [Salinarimonas ramus]|uniref:Acyl-[acyl-carrier-protein]--UDP-N-acetylglucosamine O-acyltransferase n=1 Tax=Salinarimonas ramus TaxID=690164 RepID=A0A917V2Z9_9HYPH|nr:acyl-ACP--UDP-N-acetylglucosamine O-acyltransferase [Salinarimonas ramus]GGK26389.1 acyl-[acyl-carrier-protein]--UDP-N-acetylglucosamine O-acyltransferase [Salinarimonas ramus]